MNSSPLLHHYVSRSLLYHGLLTLESEFQQRLNKSRIRQKLTRQLTRSSVHDRFTEVHLLELTSADSQLYTHGRVTVRTRVKGHAALLHQLIKSIKG
jgi:hypothetical protein